MSFDRGKMMTSPLCPYINLIFFADRYRNKIYSLLISVLTMVCKYVRKTERQAWSGESMQAAINALANKEMGAPKTAKKFRVPQTTLERRFKVFRKNAETSVAEASAKSLGAFKTVFNTEQEQELVAYILRMESCLLHGLTGKEVRSIAFQLAEKTKFDIILTRKKN